ncbi:hypothetical protein TNCV_2329101 [Trichonephila clavipes]|nr:hypothetical protein TNCV_2329101 [Trichonephila clavipes]
MNIMIDYWVASIATLRSTGLIRKYFPPRNAKSTENNSYAGSLSEEFVAVVDDNVRTTPIMANKDSLKLLQSSKNIIDADSKNETEINKHLLTPQHAKLGTLRKVCALIQTHVPMMK